MPAYSDMSIRDWYSQIEEILGDVLEHQDFSMQTWLALGAASQLFALAWLPSSFSFWLPLAWLAYRLMRTALDSWNVYHSRLWSRVMQGQWMGQLPEPEKLSEASETSEGVVMFLLGARLNQYIDISSLLGLDADNQQPPGKTWAWRCPGQRGVQRHVA